VTVPAVDTAAARVAARHPRLICILPAFIVCLAGVLLAAFLLAQPVTFGFSLDGQRVIDDRLTLTWSHLLAPFHQHLNLVPIAIWNRLAAVFGTASSTPFLAFLLLTHVTLATAATSLLTVRIGPVLALAFGLPLVLLGSAHFNLLAPWQILFTLTLMGGLVAVWASIPLERTWPRMAAVVGSLVFAVMCSNLTLFIAMALGLWFLIDDRRVQLRELIPLAVVFGAWFITWGRTGLGSDSEPTSTTAILAIVPYTITGIVSGVGGMIGLGPLAGAFILGALAVGFRPPRPMLAFFIAIAAMFAVGAMFRYMSGTDQALTSRYITLVAYMVVFGILAAGYRPPVRPAIALGVSVLVVIGNLVILARELPTYLA